MSGRLRPGREKKSYRDVIELGRRYGYELVGYTGAGHLRLVHPVAGTVFAPSTPSDRRGLRNVAQKLRQRLRESGVTEPETRN